MNVVLPRDLEKYVESLVEKGRYAASSDVIAEALRQHQDQEMRRLSDSCFSEVTALLQSRRGLLDRMASALIASEMLTGDDLQRLSAAS